MALSAETLSVWRRGTDGTHVRQEGAEDSVEGSTLVTRKHSRQKPRIGNLAGKRQGSVVRSGLVGRKAQGSFEDEAGAEGGRGGLLRRAFLTAGGGIASRNSARRVLST